MSPQFAPHRHRKRGSEVSTRSFALPVNFQPENIIHEEDGDVQEIQDLQTPGMPSLEDDISPSDMSNDSNNYVDVHEEWSTSFQPSLRRSTSHESILSIAGIDIHTLKSRPSQLTITGRGFQPLSRFGTSTSMLSTDSLTSSSIITARPTLSRHGHDSTAYLRSSMLATPTSDSRSINSSNSNEGGISKKVGGWVFGRWGVSPAKSTDNLRASVEQKRNVSQPIDPLKSFLGRPPGINQKGPIHGFVKKTEKPPSKVKPEIVDHASLKEILREGCMR
jgi:hypothetical protein